MSSGIGHLRRRREADEVTEQDSYDHVLLVHEGARQLLKSGCALEAYSRGRDSAPHMPSNAFSEA
jgi:hypothetical protein